MKKEFSPTESAYLLLISIFTYFLFFYQLLKKVFVHDITGFAIAFCAGYALFILAILLRKKTISFKSLVVNSILIPYILSIVGYVGVFLQFILFAGHINPGTDAFVVALFFPYWVGETWWLTMFIFGWLIIFSFAKNHKL